MKGQRGGLLRVLVQQGFDIQVLANYSSILALPPVLGKFYWASNSQGTQWLPGSLGGTYYPNGLYYFNGITLEYLIVPYQATQLEVNTGVNNDKFVTPLTLKNSTLTLAEISALNLKKNVPQLIFDRFEHFLNVLVGTPYTTTVSGGTITFQPLDGRLGVLRLSTNAAASANQRSAAICSASFQLGNGKTITKIFEGAFTGAIPDATNLGVYRLGFGDSATAESVDASFFRINGAGNLFAVNRSNNIESFVDLGFRPVLNQYYKFKIVANSLGTSISYFIDNMSTPVAIIATNVPSGSGRFLCELYYIQRVAAVATTMNFDIDYEYLSVVYDTPLVF